MRKHEPVALVFEPATPDGGLVIERAGSGQFIFEARGKSAHVGRDFAHGVSAVTALARCITDAAALTDLSRGTIVNISPLEGGHATNVVADSARAWGNLRFKDQPSGEDLARRLHDIAARHCGPAGALPRVEAKVSLVRAAKPATDGTMRLADLARRVSEDLGRPLPFTTTAGVCDGNILQGAGLACIDTLGVRGGGLHTPQEWIEVPSLVERCQMAALVMMRLA
jgi:glutamate carboxypeptidase